MPWQGILSHHITSHHIISRGVTAWKFASYNTSHLIASHCISSHRIALHVITSHHTTPHHTTPHHTTPHHTTPHHTKQHNTAQHNATPRKHNTDSSVPRFGVTFSFFCYLPSPVRAPRSAFAHHLTNTAQNNQSDKNNISTIAIEQQRNRQIERTVVYRYDLRVRTSV